MDLLKEADEFISIDKDDFNIIIHIPPITIPELNCNTVKLVITVNSLE